MNLNFEDQRHLHAAEGYLALGLYLEANQELETMSRPCRFRHDVLLVRFGIYRGIRNSDLMEMVAFQLARTGFCPNQILAQSAPVERPPAWDAIRARLEYLADSEKSQGEQAGASRGTP